MRVRLNSRLSDWWFSYWWRSFKRGLVGPLHYVQLELKTCRLHRLFETAIEELLETPSIGPVKRLSKSGMRGGGTTCILNCGESAECSSGNHGAK